jgi:hypothetical protein
MISSLVRLLQAWRDYGTAVRELSPSMTVSLPIWASADQILIGSLDTTTATSRGGGTDPIATISAQRATP